MTEALKDLATGIVKRYNLGSGLKPVFKIETCKSLSRGYIGDRILEDTFPMFVKVADPDTGGLQSIISTQAIKDKVSDFLGSQTTDSPMLGLMIDTAVLNRYRTIANLIFQNVLVNRPTGNQWLSEDFIQCGYPIRVTLGYVTPEGNFIQHPYEGSLVPKNIYPTFTGIVAAQTQEIVSTGDRFQITCYGFEYLLSKAQLKQFEAKKDEPIRDVFARLLMQFATMSDFYDLNATEAEELFDAPRDTPKWPIPILKAMGLVDRNGQVYDWMPTVKKKIRFMNISENHTPRLLQDLEVPAHFKGKEKISYLDVINTIAPRPPDTIEAQMALAEGRTPVWSDQDDPIRGFYSRNSFFFDYHGRPTIMGHFMSTTEIAGGKSYITHDKDRERVHDAVIGSNIIHIQLNNTLDMSSGRLDLYYLDPSPRAGPPSFTPASNEHAPRFVPTGTLEKDALYYYGPASHWGRRDVFFFDQGKNVDDPEAVDALDESLENLKERYKNLGLRGSSYMIANPKIQVGDVLRIVDIRDKQGFGTAVGATIDLAKSVASKISSAFSRVVPSASTPNIENQSINLGLAGVEDTYFIWKVRHYVGQTEVTTKAFFVKEPQTLIGTTDAYQQHQIQRRKVGAAGGPAGPTP